MSYQTKDRRFAGTVRQALERFGVNVFMAHDDLEISEEWKARILLELEAANLFVAILSANYLQSAYCMHEGGIAAFRKITVAPLSLDRTVPPGFMDHIQSIRVDPETFTSTTLVPSLFKCNRKFAFKALTERLRQSKTYREAEADFRLILPYVDGADRDEIVGLLVASAENNQVRGANLCVTEYLPPIFNKYRRHIPEHYRDILQRAID